MKTRRNPILASARLLAVAAVLAFPHALRAEAPAYAPPPDELASPPELQEAAKKQFPTTVADLKAIETQVRKVVKHVTPATVGIRMGASQGSGVIISEDGIILTAGHVIGEPNKDCQIVLHDGRVVKGKTLGINRAIDSGMAKIVEEGKWPHVHIAKADDMKAGQWCVSTGHPGGYYQDRKPVVRLGRILFANDQVICSDCTLVGGDSGGPLFNLEGEVIGIHSRIGMQITTNFHVPISTFRQTWDRLASAEIWGGRLGSMRPERVRPLVGIAGDPSGEPCRVNQVFPGSPAEKAGFREGDVIEKFDGKAVTNFDELAKLVEERKPGQKIPVDVVRGDEKLTVDLVLGAVQGNFPGGRPQPREENEDEDS